MGPGGLDILKSGTGNRRVVCLPALSAPPYFYGVTNTHLPQSLAAPSRPPPRSILKPTIPLLPEIPPHKPRKGNASTGPGASGSNPSDNTDNSGTKIALRTEEEQQAAVREREERERVQMEKEINDRREARRKSLANRRVSFAAEATLHTFHEVEYMQDSTTSTDSTRRASSVAAPSPAPRTSEHESNDSEPPSTPPEHAETATESPANLRDLHQRKHRRSSGAASNYDDDTVYDSDLEHADDVTEIQGEEMTDSGDDSEEDGTLMTVEAEEMTSASVASIASLHSAFSGDSTGELDENLRLAARTAATQRLDDDEEVIAGFAGWGKKNISKENLTQDVKPTMVDEEPGLDVEMTMDMDMDMTNAVGGILHPEERNKSKDDDMDMSMEVTKALGGILLKPNTRSRRKSVRATPNPSGDATSFGDMTMEFTTAVGGIKQSRVSDVSHLTTDSNEDMSMEITAAVGAVLAGSLAKTGAQNNRRKTIAEEDDEASMMEMTMAVGRILPDQSAQEGDDETMGMDMTVTVGGIIKPSPAQTPEVRSAARKVMELEADQPDPSVTDSVEIAPPLPKRRSSRGLNGESSSDLAGFKGKSISRSPLRSPLPKVKPTPSIASSPPKTASPFRSPSPKSRTPNKTKTPPAMIGSRSSSPVRSVSPTKTTPRSPSKIKKLFHQDPNTGASTPRVVLTPQGRRLSGVGADRSGLGSPKVVEIFDRRISIGDAATNFVPGQAASARRVVSFADPRAMEAEIDRERHDEQEKENSRRILQREVDGLQDGPETTQSLKEMIQGLSPKKSLLRGRKSLHVGSARGLLGKRPAELDDEETEDADGVKRLKGHQGSPVKNIRLQSPPSKAETTTGRKTRAGLRSADNTAMDIITPTVTSSPPKASSPKHQGRFKVVDDQPTNTMDFDHTVVMDDAEMQQDGDGERIHLQDFLNMTSIRFMELTTTKRRHTVAPSASRDSSAPDGNEDVSLEKCAVTGACTVPMLELYQHVGPFPFRETNLRWLILSVVVVP